MIGDFNTRRRCRHLLQYCENFVDTFLFQASEALVVEEVPDQHADGPVPGGDPSRGRGPPPPHLRLLHRPQPHPHVQRLPLLGPLSQVLQQSLQEEREASQVG